MRGKCVGLKADPRGRPTGALPGARCAATGNAGASVLWYL